MPFPPDPTSRHIARVAAVASAAILLAACASDAPASPTLAEVTGPQVLGADGADGADDAADDGDGAGASDEIGTLSAAALRTWFADAPGVLVCDGADPASVERATQAGTAAGIPVLCGQTPADFADLLNDLNTDVAFTVGAVDAETLEVDAVVAVPQDAEPESLTDGSLGEEVPSIERADAPEAPLVALSTDVPETAPARATAAAAGANVVVAPVADPRASAETVEALDGQDAARVVAIGEGWGDVEALTWKIETAADGTQLPGGGQLVVPGKTYIALYGTPGTGALGVLGEQDVEATVTRAEKTADWYAGID